MKLLFFTFRKHRQKDPNTETAKQCSWDPAMLLLHCDVYLFTSDLSFPLASLSAACPLTPIQSFAFKECFPVCSAKKGGRPDGCVLFSQFAMQVMAIAVSNWRRLKFLLSQPHAFLKCKISHGFGLKRQGHQANLKFVWTKGSIHEVQAIWLPLNVHT